MKSQVFLKAWELVRSLEMSFRDALRLAWKQVKYSVMYAKKEAVSVFDWKLKQSIEKDLVVLAEEIHSLKPMQIRINVCDNSGAAAWYDGKTFNND